jgi:hypothetical protein
MNNENPETQQNTNPVNQVEGQSPQELQPVAPPTPNQKWYRKKIVLAIAIILVLVAGGAAALVLTHKKPTSNNDTVANNSTQKPQTTPKTLKQNQLCFVRLAYLVCVDSSGQNRVRYDLPKLQDGSTINSLVATPDQSQYVATFSNGKNIVYWTLDTTLKPVKKLDFGGLVRTDYLGRIAFSVDGKSIVLNLDANPNNSAQKVIYRYNLSSGKLTKVINANAFGSIAETKDGHVLYGSYDLFEVNTDGSGVRKLSLAPITGITAGLEFSYDLSADKVLVLGWDSQNKNVLGYADSASFSSGKALSIVPTEPDQYTSAFFVDSNTIIGFEGVKANIFNLKGSVTATVKQAGEPVGLLDTSAFKKSTEQTEQTSDLIGGYNTAPADFQAYILPLYTQQNAQCLKDNNDTTEFGMSIIKVVNDTFAQTGESCQDGGNVYYKKVSGSWTKTDLHGQSINECATVNKYAYTKEIIDQCVSNGNPIANTNP